MKPIPPAPFPLKKGRGSYEFVPKSATCHFERREKSFSFNKNDLAFIVDVLKAVIYAPFRLG
ncbi:hypothetical protein Cabys_3431 [Caldithrix abyssi DSM 13497]|uniref:Uncharacterized protein n=1 Tax=Caldithrix abyssi DSM 13497 TaxID=880073 RepID=A0A1J1CD59_CALAY|nr:hypothetical protein Cabys_3431 [Caldithrix abyssi DSM 13497]